MFLKLETHGAVKLYTFYQMLNGAYGKSHPETSILQRGDGEMLIIKKGSFEKDVCAFLGECTPLIGKIESKEFKRKDIKAIVEFYNEWKE